MQMDSVLDDIQDLNLSYLLLVQRLLSEDRATAMFRLKMDDAMADLILSLSGKQLGRLARTNQLLCRLNFDDATQLEQLTSNPRDQGLGSSHAALLMSAIGAGTASVDARG